MKKALYFAVLVFACNVSAQDISAIIRRDQAELNQRNEALLSIGESQVKTNAILMNELVAIYNTEGHNVIFSPIQLVDSIYYWRWDLESSTWEVFKKRIDIIYNESNAYTSTTDQYWNGSQWINSDLHNYKFDGRDNLTQFSIYTWDISTWQKFLRILSVFDINNNRTSATNQQGINNQWDNLNKSIMVYDEHNNLTQRNTQIWQAPNWVDQNQYFYTYDSNNNVINFIGQDWDGLAWKDSRQKTYMYDTYDNEILVLNQIWNGNEWENSEQTTNTFDDNRNRLSSKYQRWDGLAWNNINFNFSTYDSHDNEIRLLTQDWNGNYWENNGLSIRTYHDENILSTELHQYWDGTKWENSSQKLYRFENNIPAGYLTQEWEGGVWINQLQYIDHFDKDNLLNSTVFWRYDDFGIVNRGDSTQYFYRTLTDAGELLQEHETVSIFPNPCNGKFRISSPDHIDRITFFSILGERLYFNEGPSQKGTPDIDISGFGSGIYFMVLESGGHRNTQKVVVQ